MRRSASTLPGETAQVETVPGHADRRHALRIETESPERIAPICPHFGVCGGCATQHADERTQMAAKQRWLEDCLERIGKVKPESLLPIVQGEEWGYRHRARLSVHYVAKKGGVLVGFHERRSSFVADTMSCEVMPPAISLTRVNPSRCSRLAAIDDR